MDKNITLLHTLHILKVDKWKLQMPHTFLLKIRYLADINEGIHQIEETDGSECLLAPWSKVRGGYTKFLHRVKKYRFVADGDKHTDMWQLA